MCLYAERARALGFLFGGFFEAGGILAGNSISYYQLNPEKIMEVVNAPFYKIGFSLPDS
jgi:hypothetical protein